MDTKVGIGVAILRLHKGRWEVLLGKRKGSHGEGEWAFPGGSMEHLEGFEDTALREIKEEVGVDIRIDDLRVVSIINLTEYAPKHYIDIGMTANYLGGVPYVMEPEKSETWEWFDIDQLPSPLFVTVERVIEAAVSPYSRYDTAVVYDKEQF